MVPITGGQFVTTGLPRQASPSPLPPSRSTHAPNLVAKPAAPMACAASRVSWRCSIPELTTSDHSQQRVSIEDMPEAYQQVFYHTTFSGIMMC
jgi:hypothetical protein